MKSPAGVLDYQWNWTQWLATGESIADSQFVATAGIITGPQAATHDATTATVWLSGGTLCEMYTVTNRITTDQGRVREHSIRVQVLDT